MNIFDVLTMVGGLCLFLFGMDVMGKALERRAGSGLRTLLGRLTTNKLAGLFTGICVTAVIQSSSATTVMVVGFVNSAVMTLGQAINVIMGANIGTTITAWILSLSGIDSSNIFVQLLKPSSFTPVLALIGIIMYMTPGGKKRDTGTILLGFATLMFGMDTMSGAVKGLSEIEGFKSLFLLFKNPFLGVLAGAVLTAIIQSSSASVGILQALAITGQVSYGAAIPIIMGQNIGTCVTAIISAIGANKNARRAAFVHLFFNIIGTLVGLLLFIAIRFVFQSALFDAPASLAGIAFSHSVFNIFCTIILFPCSSLLEKLVMHIIPEGTKREESITELDERLLTTPSIALERCHKVALGMVDGALKTLRGGVRSISEFSSELAENVRSGEEKSDHYEDILGTYLVKLSSRRISEKDAAEAAKLLKIIGDFERISDHGVNILLSSEEMLQKQIKFTPAAEAELGIIFSALDEILSLTEKAFVNNDIDSAHKVEPLEQVIDNLKEQMRTRHILRLQQGESTIDAGFVWSDILTNVGRASDHCSNIAGCVIDIENNNMNLHESLRAYKSNSDEFKESFKSYKEKYALPAI